MMDIRDFGDALIRTGDLDPVYIAIHGAKLDQQQLQRLLLAYFCFYHLGVAGWISQFEGKSFWGLMTVAAENEVPPGSITAGLPGHRWPRAAERRHFRGAKCVEAVEYLQRHFERPEAPVSWLMEDVRTEQDVMLKIQRWPMFGSWIAFKAADMLERVAGVPLNFSENIGLIYAEPRKALDLLSKTPGFITTDPTPEGIYQGLLTYFQPRRAPPSGDRFCGPQEVETVLCKWKSHANGHYEVGKDIAEVTHALDGWGATAERMLRALNSNINNNTRPGASQSAKAGAVVG